MSLLSVAFRTDAVPNLPLVDIHKTKTATSEVKF